MSTDPANDLSTTARSAAPGLSAWKLATLLFLVSFATVTFMLCIFRLLGFFIMPSLFFHLLFIGFPLGAFVGARYFEVSVRDFGRSLTILQAIMLVSVLMCLLCKHVDYLRARMYDLDVGTLFIQIGWFSAIFLPFFCAYGLSEYIGYQIGRRTLKNHMRAVYSVYLFGAALAYLAVRYGVGELGITRLMILSVAVVVGSALVIAARRVRLSIELLVLVGAAFLPNLDGRLLDLYKGVYQAPMTSTKGMGDDWSHVHQEWGRYALCELMESPDGRTIAGFYNDALQWWYTSPYGLGAPTLDALPFLLVPPGGRVVVVGSGGGRQIKWATTQHSFEEVVAVEIEPEVFEFSRKDFPGEFDRVYEDPVVTPVRAEGRTYLTETEKRFDLIFMPSVGGYPQMMLEPGNMIRTFEAYSLMKERLTPRGVVAIWYPRGLDPKGILTRQYVDTFRSLDMHTTWYQTRDDTLIISSPVEEQSILPKRRLDAFLAGEAGPFLAAPPRFRPRKVGYAGDPDFRPITDEKPFLAGNIANIFTAKQVQAIFGLLTAGLLTVGLAAFLLLRRRGNPNIPGISYPTLVLVSLLVGANFLVMEHALVIALFQKTFVYYDSLTLGAIGFLFLTGVGSMLVSGPRLKPAYVAGTISPICLLFFARTLPPIGLVLVMLPAVFTIGSFFPMLFELARRNPLAVFAMDAIGAALGSLCTFYVPITFGLSRIVGIAAVLQILTLGVMILVLKRSRVPSDEPAPPA